MKCDSVFWFNITGARLEERRLPGDFFLPATQLIFPNATQPHFLSHSKSLHPPVPKIHWQVSQLLAGPPAKLRSSAARPRESSSAKKTPATLLALDPQTRHKPAHRTVTTSSYNSPCWPQGLLFFTGTSMQHSTSLGLYASTSPWSMCDTKSHYITRTTFSTEPALRILSFLSHLPLLVLESPAPKHFIASTVATTFDVTRTPAAVA